MRGMQARRGKSDQASGRVDTRWLWPLAAVALLAFVARIVPTPRTIDDAFITFRYARNLVAGLGLVYNPGEPVLGTTTPLYALLLAGLSAVTQQENYPWLALLVNSAADAAGCLVLAGLAVTLTGRRALGLAAALLWAIAPMSVTFAIGGMETSIFILLLLLAALAYVRGRTRLAAAAGALILLTRPDGALLVAPLILDLVLRRARQKQSPFAEAGIFLAVLAPWVIFATLFYGSPVPASIAAKSVAYRLDTYAALVRLIQHYGTPFFEHTLLSDYFPLYGFILYMVVSLLGGLAVVRRHSTAWPLAVFPALYFAAYAIANPPIFRWYLAPPLPFYFILILAGLARIFDDVARALRRLPAAWPARALLIPVGLYVALFVAAWTPAPDHGPARPAPKMAWHLLELYYTDLGRTLAPRLGPGSLLAAGDVGALGYYTNARILDAVGLISPEAVAYFPLDPEQFVITYAIPAQLILAFQPDYVVFLESYGRKSLLADPAFQAGYVLDTFLPTDIYSSNGLLVYRRLSP
jgi:arabinofuranosyltransferase